MTKLVYFAWVRERIGTAEEEIALPDDIEKVSDLLTFLQTRGDNYAMALCEPDVIRVALDKVHAEHDEKLGAPREIALFPPMTGG